MGVLEGQAPALVPKISGTTPGASLHRNSLELAPRAFSRYDLAVRKVSLKDVREEERSSPKGKFHKFVREISIAMGREKNSLDLGKRHPFDVAFIRIPAGKAYCPYHSHSAETEFYLVVSGHGRVRDKDGTVDVHAGDAFLFHPGEAHQLSNPGPDDLVYYVVADNPRGDGCFYPDSG